MTRTEDKRTFFNALAASWDEMSRDRQMDEGIRKFVQAAYAGDAKTVLDVGCGTGILIPYLLPLYARAEIVIELDFAEEMLALNRSKFPDRQLVRLAADAANLPFPGESIGAIFCFNVAPHLGHLPAAFQDLFRVLAPGGSIAVGHLMSSAELNRFHGTLQAPVAHDRLPPAADMGAWLARLGGKDIVAQEEPGWYFVRATKSA